MTVTSITIDLLAFNLRMSTIMSLNHIIKQRQKKNTILKEEAMNEAERLVRLLKEQFDFETVYIFGSLATGRFRRHSDIDMAVKGMKIEDYFKAYALLIKESRFDVDLKPLEDLSKNLKEKIIKEGIKIG